MRPIFQLLVSVVSFFLVSISQAGGPVWTMAPDPNFPPTQAINAADTATIKYTVTNQSHKQHTLVMNSIAGVSQDTTAGNCQASFTLGYQQSCVLTLQVSGSDIQGSLVGGPVVCQQGSALQCYQPEAGDTLNITVNSIAKYLVTPSSGSNGSISPSTPQTVNTGSNLNFVAAPQTNYQVNQWLVDGGVAQTGGTTFTLQNIVGNHTVEVTFTQSGTLYTGTLGGNVYYSMNNGLSWMVTTPPSATHGVNSVFATDSTLYVGNSDGYVYFSTNNGVSWNMTSSPDNSAINGVFVTISNNITTIYVGTEDGRVMYSTDGNNWTSVTQPSVGYAVKSIFITPSSALYAGSEDGHVYYSTDNGTSWTQITGPSPGTSIRNIFATATKLYANTADEYTYTSSNLTSSGSWTLHTQVTYSLFVNDDASIIYAGTQSGYVFSLLTGNELGFIAYDAINSVFFKGSN